MIAVVRPGRFIFFLLITAIIIAGSGYGFFKLIWGESTIKKSGDFVIHEGSAAGVVWQQLVAADITSRTLPWHYHGWRLKAANNLQSGTYFLNTGESVRDVISRFMTGDTSPDELTITFPEGFTLEQMAARTTASDIGTAEQFIQSASVSNFINTYPYLAELAPNRNLEGYLFPDTYRVFASDTPSDVIRRMLANFDQKLTADLRRAALAQNRSIDQIIIMASIIEREVISNEDMAKVSGVLWKRFDDGVGLAADATVRYILEQWDEPLTKQDLAVDSAYNTRRYRGLPPGPISNPGLRAIIAAVRPEPSDYYYYLSTPQGETIFSTTLEEHNLNKTKYLR